MPKFRRKCRLLIYLTSFKSGFKFSIGKITQGDAEGEADGKNRNVDLDEGPNGKKTNSIDTPTVSVGGTQRVEVTGPNPPRRKRSRMHESGSGSEEELKRSKRWERRKGRRRMIMEKSCYGVRTQASNSYLMHVSRMEVYYFIFFMQKTTR